jgi:hypothetical protein
MAAARGGCPVQRRRPAVVLVGYWRWDGGGMLMGYGDTEGDDDEEMIGKRSCRHHCHGGHSHTSTSHNIAHYPSQSSRFVLDIRRQRSYCTSLSRAVFTRTTAKPAVFRPTLQALSPCSTMASLSSVSIQSFVPYGNLGLVQVCQLFDPHRTTQPQPQPPLD